MDAPWGFDIQPPMSTTECPEKIEIDKFEPMDFAHLIRAHRANIALAWLANDPIAKWLIRQDAETARMSWFLQRINADYAFATNNPGKGLHYSRIQGWMLRIIAEAYALGSDKLRTRFNTEKHKLVQTVTQAETPVGIINCDVIGKESRKEPYFSNKLGVAVCIQHGLFTGGYYAYCMALGVPFDIMPEKGVNHLLRGSNTLWSVAIRPIDATKPVFLTVPNDSSGLPMDATHPAYPDGKASGFNVDSEQTRATVGLAGLNALKANDQPTVDYCVNLAKRMMGPNPKAALLGLGMQVTDSDSILLAFCQKVGLP
jgi:hypothetical protein